MVRGTTANGNAGIKARRRGTAQRGGSEDETEGRAGAGLRTRVVALKAFSSCRRAFARSARVWCEGAGGLQPEERRRGRFLGSLEGPEGRGRGKIGGYPRAGAQPGQRHTPKLVVRSRWRGLGRCLGCQPKQGVVTSTGVAISGVPCKVTRARPTVKG